MYLQMVPSACALVPTPYPTEQGIGCGHIECNEAALLNQLDSALHDGILRIHHLEILAHIPQVAGNERLKLQTQLRQCLLQFRLILRHNLLLAGLKSAKSAYCFFSVRRCWSI